MQLIRGSPGVSNVWHDMLCQHMDDTRLPCFSYNTSHRLFYVLFVVEVRGAQRLTQHVEDEGRPG